MRKQLAIKPIRPQISKRVCMWTILTMICCIGVQDVSSQLLLASSPAAPPEIFTYAEGAVLMDVQSGRVLYSKSGDKPMRIASLTKIMTAIIAIEQGNLSDMVEVSPVSYGKEGSSLYLKLGEQMSLHHMLYGMMLRSGNDAATAIAEHIGGSVEGFAYVMNEKAQLLGMDNSHFINPTGLDDGEGHYASAYDLAILTTHALKNPNFQDIVKTKHKKAPNPHETWDYQWTNKNKMLVLFEGADGVKTGYTQLAKRCLVSSATRDGQQLVVVTLNDANDWADHTKLFAHGFLHYPQTTLIASQHKLADDSWQATQDFSYPLTKEERSHITQVVVRHPADSLIHRLGEYGYLELKLDGQLMGRIPIKPVHPHPKSTRPTNDFILRRNEGVNEIW